MDKGRTELFEFSKINLHTHSWYCKHGSGELAEYVDEAIKNNLEVLGFSEHCPVPTNKLNDTRMDYSQQLDYITEIRDLKKVNRDIKLLVGFECDYLDLDYHYYKELLSSKKVDYLCFGIHTLQSYNNGNTYLKNVPDDKKLLHEYTDDYIKALDSGLFLFGAHPDLFGAFYKNWDNEAIDCSKEILSCAQELKIPLEINGYGLRKEEIDTPLGLRKQYPLKDFWQLARKYDILTTTHSDAHIVEDLVINSQECYQYAKSFDKKLCSLGITYRQNSDNGYEVLTLALL